MNIIRELWTGLLCLILGHKYTPIGPDEPRSHCVRCGLINPADIWC